MSYEGYHQVLCRNGHYVEIDCYEEPLFCEQPRFDLDCKIWTCPICGEKAYWSNSVDVTNESFDKDGNRIDDFVELRKTTSVDQNKLNLVKSLAAVLDKNIVVSVVDTYQVTNGMGGVIYKHIISTKEEADKDEEQKVAPINDSCCEDFCDSLCHCNFNSKKCKSGGFYSAKQETEMENDLYEFFPIG